MLYDLACFAVSFTSIAKMGYQHRCRAITSASTPNDLALYHLFQRVANVALIQRVIHNRSVVPCLVARFINRDVIIPQGDGLVLQCGYGPSLWVLVFGLTSRARRDRCEQKGSFHPVSRLRISITDLAPGRFVLDGSISKDVRYGVVVSTTISVGCSRDVLRARTNGVDGQV